MYYRRLFEFDSLFSITIFFQVFSSNHGGAGSTSKAHEEGNNPLELPGNVHLCVC
jgi:hypothetical protein